MPEEIYNKLLDFAIDKKQRVWYTLPYYKSEDEEKQRKLSFTESGKW